VALAEEVAKWAVISRQSWKEAQTQQPTE